MSDNVNPIRAYRKRTGLSLDRLADLIEAEGCERPSTAKLSRIETGVQPVTLDILPALKKIMRLPGRKLRPDLAKLMGRAVA